MTIEERNDYTVEVYKQDYRYTNKERLVDKKDYIDTTENELASIYAALYNDSKYRFEIHKTYITKKNFITGFTFKERYDTPYFCSASSETYWST